ncbi:unnamed protein product, partial [Amoebophrya sp. A25]
DADLVPVERLVPSSFGSKRVVDVLVVQKRIGRELSLLDEAQRARQEGDFTSMILRQSNGTVVLVEDAVGHDAVMQKQGRGGHGLLDFSHLLEQVEFTPLTEMQFVVGASGRDGNTRIPYFISAITGRVLSATAVGPNLKPHPQRKSEWIYKLDAVEVVGAPEQETFITLRPGDWVFARPDGDIVFPQNIRTSWSLSLLSVAGSKKSSVSAETNRLQVVDHPSTPSTHLTDMLQRAEATITVVGPRSKCFSSATAELAIFEISQLALVVDDPSKSSSSSWWAVYSANDNGASTCVDAAPSDWTRLFVDQVLSFRRALFFYDSFRNEIVPLRLETVEERATSTGKKADYVGSGQFETVVADDSTLTALLAKHGNRSRATTSTKNQAANPPARKVEGPTRRHIEAAYQYLQTCFGAEKWKPFAVEENAQVIERRDLELCAGHASNYVEDVDIDVALASRELP